MNMILKAAVASAIAVAGVGTSQALNISAYAGNSATNVNVFISGSTALDNTVVNGTILTAAPGGLCAAGTVDIYRIGTSETMVYCSAASTSGVTAGLPLAIFKESNAGSANGVNPLILAAKGLASGVFFLSPAALVTAGGDAACTTAAVAATATLGAYTNHTACPSTAVTAANVAPTGGLADVEAKLLRIKDNALITGADTYLNSTGVLDVVWGVPVTKSLFYALQAAEGLPSPSDLPANAPSLSRQAIASLYAGNVFNWTSLGLTNPTGDNNVYICRRDIQSGTQASFEAYFMGARCSSASTAIAKQDGQFIFSNPSGGAVRTCLTALEQGGTITPTNGDFTGDNFAPVTIAAPGGKWGIGILSTEVSAANLTPDTFRMVAVDGVLPTLPNAVNGHYQFWSSAAGYTIKAGFPNAPSGNALAVWNTLETRLGDPAPTAGIDANYAGRPWGNGGDLAPAAQFVTGPATVTIPATSASTTSSPINSFTKQSSGTVNNCDTPVSFSGVGGAIQQKIPVQNRLLGTGNVNN